MLDGRLARLGGHESAFGREFDSLADIVSFGVAPALQVYVHEKGAPHMASPEKLVASATRLYGSDMDRLWGAVLPDIT